MFLTKRQGNRSTRRGFVSKQPPATRRGQKHWVVRWIGAAKRRVKKPTVQATAPSAHVIQLSFADTFSRPVRPGVPIGGAQLLTIPRQHSADISPRYALPAVSRAYRRS